jgi:hypothetical protein
LARCSLAASSVTLTEEEMTPGVAAVAAVTA